MSAANPQRVLRALLRESFPAFLHKALITVHPTTPFLDNWHIRAIAYQLERVALGEERRLIINQPPRSLKSITVSVAYVAWLLGKDPSKQIIVVSYSREFAADLHRLFRAVVESDWYRQLFPATKWKKQTDSDFVTTMGGGRLSTSIGGQLTGRGGDLLIIDDPMNALEAQSEPARQEVINFYSTTLVSRLNNKGTQPIILVMQRLHENDLAGHLIEKGGWYHLNLPAIATEDAEIPVGRRIIHHRLSGDVLHPARESFDTLMRIKTEIGSLTFSAQYQQSPLPAEGNIVKREWIESSVYTELPSTVGGAMIVQSWDIATTTGPNNDFSVCTTWLATKKDVYLMHVWRGRLTTPNLRLKIAELARQFAARTVLIEEATFGLALLQDLRQNTPEGMVRPIGVKPVGDKLDRMHVQSTRIEAGVVHLPTEAPWLGDYLTELLGFNNTRHDDQVDSTSQFLGWWSNWTRNSGVIAIPIIFSTRRPDPFDAPNFW